MRSNGKARFVLGARFERGTLDRVGQTYVWRRRRLQQLFWAL